MRKVRYIPSRKDNLPAVVDRKANRILALFFPDPDRPGLAEHMQTLCCEVLNREPVLRRS